MLAQAPHSTLAVADTTGVNSWKVSAKHGTQSGIGGSVSGSGAWVGISGTMNFQLQHLDASTDYQSLQSQYNFSSGTSGFWGWLVGGSHTSEQKTQIHNTFKQIANSQKVQGTAKIDLSVTGQYPNVQVDASAYVLILQIEDEQGNTYQMFSTGNPTGDTGAQSSNGTSLPTKGNSSTISI